MSANYVAERREREGERERDSRILALSRVRATRANEIRAAEGFFRRGRRVRARLIFNAIFAGAINAPMRAITRARVSAQGLRARGFVIDINKVVVKFHIAIFLLV